MAIKDLYPSIRPTLDLNFAGTRTIDPRITFTRSSTATYFDEFGVMRTAPANTPRTDFDPVTGECKGLLIEEQRTNLLLDSATLATQNVTVTAVAHTLTFYGTGTVSLSGAATEVLVGTGAANRVALTFTPTAGTLTLTVTGSCTQGQLEVGAYPTSYIQTTSAQATRAADVATMTGINFSSWYRQGVGTFIATYSVPGAGIHPAFEVTDGGTSNYIRHVTNLAGVQRRYDFLTGGVIQAQLVLTFSGSFNLFQTDAVAYTNNDAAASMNGLTPVVDIDGLVVASNLTQLNIGSSTINAGPAIGGHIKRIAYYPQRLSNIQLQAITA